MLICKRWHIYIAKCKNETAKFRQFRKIVNEFLNSIAKYSTHIIFLTVLYDQLYLIIVINHAIVDKQREKYFTRLEKIMKISSHIFAYFNMFKKYYNNLITRAVFTLLSVITCRHSWSGPMSSFLGMPMFDGTCKMQVAARRNALTREIHYRMRLVFRRMYTQYMEREGYE